MNAHRFDRIAKTLPDGTRRGVVRLLATFPLAGMLAGLRGAMPEASVAAERRRHSRKAKTRARAKHEPKSSAKTKHTGTDRAKAKPRKRGKDPTRKTAAARDKAPKKAKATCTPAIEACWDKHGVPVRGACECAWIADQDGVTVGDFPCQGDCICMLTIEGTGFCGGAPPLPDGGSDGCAQSADCAPIVHDDGRVTETACIVWGNNAPFCYVACKPRRP